MEANAAPAAKRKKPRSPSYPSVGLADALDRALVLYQHERDNPAPVDTILGHWGYSPKSGAGLVVVAALKKFGLLADNGSGDTRTGQLTPLALDILLDSREDSPERQAKIQQAAQAPTIHREILERHPNGLPSDANLAFYLTRERGFTEGAARDLIAQLRGTLEYAGLTGNGGTLSRQDEDTAPAEEDDKMGGAGTQERTRRQHPPPPPPSGNELTIPVVLTNGQARVRLQGTFPLTNDEWDRMIALLDAHKPGLTKSDD
ncbi:MAG TPA: hypothetical protein VF715_06805 [Thermoleophilaceae bacterium]